MVIVYAVIAGLCYAWIAFGSEAGVTTDAAFALISVFALLTRVALFGLLPLILLAAFANRMANKSASK